MRAQRLEIERVGHGAFANQVAPSDFDPADADLRGDRIEQPFAHEGAFETAGRAIGAAWGLVGEADVAARAIGLHAIGPGQHRGGKIRNGRGVRAHIGAVVVEKCVFEAENTPLCVDCGPDFVALLTRVVGGDQMLATVLYPFDRRAKLQRGGTHQQIFGIKFAADAEATPDVTLK